jgi:large conductance mechanosensitive channel
MPPIGYLLGGVDFSKLKIVIKAGDEAAKVAEVAIKYGNFINILIQFIIIAFCVFLIIKALNASKKKEDAAPVVPAAPPEPSTTDKLLMEIRDSLKK